MLVANLLAGPVQDEVLPVANAWHELNTKDVCEAEDDVRAFVGATRDEVAEQGDVQVGDVVVYRALVNGRHQRI